MNSERLPALIRAARETDEAGRDGCPDEQELAEYVDGAVSPDDRTRLETHFADCATCLRLIGLLSQEQQAGPAEPVPPQVLARAEQLVARKLPVSRRLLPYLAAAASIVLAVSVVVQFGLVGVSNQTDPYSGAPTTRTLPKSAGVVEVLAPSPGAIVDPEHLTVRWTEVPASRYYQIRIVDDSGDLIAQERVNDNVWQPSPTLALRSGSTYFVHVDAFPTDGKSVSSEHIPFRVSD